MKTYVIVKPNCRELANHLWNYVSIYAYGIETGARVQNPSFIEWHRYFSLRNKELFLTRVVARLPILHGIWKTMLEVYGSYLIRVCARCVRLTLGVTMYLPPTRPIMTREDMCETTYFVGWHFRNPDRLKQYRGALIAAFMPKEIIVNEIKRILAPFQGKRLIGVHVRQQPYTGFADGSFLVPLPRVRRIINEYLRENTLKAKNIALVVVSDKNVDWAVFDGFATHIQCGNDITALFLLSKCSVVIGSNSTFTNLSAWFGNVPHIVATNEPIDWKYYRNPTTYFENKYATFAQ